MEGGYYSDPALQCQAFHVCVRSSLLDLTKYSFLCPNGSLFDQQYFICDFWFNVDCGQAETLYSLNDALAAEREANIGAVAPENVLGMICQPADFTVHHSVKFNVKPIVENCQ